MWFGLCINWITFAMSIFEVWWILEKKELFFRKKSQIYTEWDKGKNGYWNWRVVGLIKTMISTYANYISPLWFEKSKKKYWFDNNILFIFFHHFLRCKMVKEFFFSAGRSEYFRCREIFFLSVGCVSVRPAATIWCTYTRKVISSTKYSAGRKIRLLVAEKYFFYTVEGACVRPAAHNM